MRSIVASYLIQHGSCSLPGIGTLSLLQVPAAADFVNKQLIAPYPAVHFSEEQTHDEALISYIASVKHLNRTSAETELNLFCDRLAEDNPLALDGIGELSSNSGYISFKSQKIPAFFLQPLIAERVIHPEAEHAILVGDKETTNTRMTEYYSDEPQRKSRWWIGAIVLTLAGAAGLFLKYYQEGSKIFP